MRYRLRSTGKIVEYNLINYSRIDALNALLNNKTMEPYNYSANHSLPQNESYGSLAITSAILSSTSGKNKTTDNLTVAVAGLTRGQFTVNWVVNGTHLLVLNLPWHNPVLTGSPCDFSCNMDFSKYFNYATLGNTDRK